MTQINTSGIDISLLVNDAINEIIEKSEDRTRGVQQGSASKTIAVRNNSRNNMDTYIVRGTWRYNAYGEGILKIYLTKSNLLDHRI